GRRRGRDVRAQRRDQRARHQRRRRSSSVMTIERINPPQLAPAAGFSHAVRSTGRATVHLAGQTALDADGTVVGEGIVAQFEKALGSLLAAMKAGGGALQDLVSLTCYIVDVDDYKQHAREIGKVWKRLVGTDYPAMAAVGVALLWDVEALVEV